MESSTSTCKGTACPGLDEQLIGGVEVNRYPHGLDVGVQVGEGQDSGDLDAGQAFVAGAGHRVEDGCAVDLGADVLVREAEAVRSRQGPHQPADVVGVQRVVLV
ncbi:hypothetical protein [Streptomyces sp. NPDC057413]|uniref:hypothetical protein n=1 Tax=Streptomyces sp. NPDC057413 TaxID=3346124 RepID=UPI00367CC6A8